MIITIFAWSLFYFLHSWLASDGVKLFCDKQLSLCNKHYRLVYNFIALLTFALAFIIQREYTSANLYFDTDYNRIAGGILIIIGGVIAYLAFKKYDTAEFLGLKTEKRQPLIIDGWNRYVRHPLYFATFIILVGYFIYTPKLGSIIFLVVSILYIFVGTKLEEKKLIQQYGDDYVSYKKQVKMIIPFLI